MHLFQRYFQRHAALFIIVMLALMTAACGSGDSRVETGSSEGNSGVSLPWALRTANLPDNGTLSAYITVDGGARQQMIINVDVASTSLSGISLGNRTFVIEFEYVLNSHPDTPFIIARATTDLNVVAGINSLNVAETEYDTTMDDDGDDLSNLLEIQNGSNPFAGFVISAMSANTTEAGDSATFTVALSTQPTAEVSFSVTSSDPSEGTVDLSQISFDTTNWNEPQILTVTGIDDDLSDGDVNYQITLGAAVSTDSNYSGNDPEDVTVTNSDNDATPTVTLSMDNASIDEGSGVATVTATMSGLFTLDVIVNLTYSGAAAESDYSKVDSITVTAGDLTGTANITAIQDDLDEDDETIIVDIDSISNAIESGIQSVQTAITDDDQQPTVTLSINTTDPLAEALGAANITATLSEVSGRAVTVHLAYSGTASEDTDYSKSDSIIIAAGFTFAQADITAVQDTLVEDDETIIIDVSSVTNAAEVTAQQVSTSIIDDDFSIGGTVTGLSGSGLILQNNSGDDLPITGNGSFTFVAGLLDGSGYSVSVSVPPSTPSQTCLVNNATGTISGANITNVSISCTTNTYLIGGTVSGLVGTLVLQNNGGNDLTLTANAPFAFTTALSDLSAYTVSVSSQPADKSAQSIMLRVH